MGQTVRGVSLWMHSRVLSVDLLPLDAVPRPMLERLVGCEVITLARWLFALAQPVQEPLRLEGKRFVSVSAAVVHVVYLAFDQGPRRNEVSGNESTSFSWLPDQTMRRRGEHPERFLDTCLQI